MRTFRKIRRSMNERLAKADREGRLGPELRRIERDALEWWFGSTTRPKAGKPRGRKS